MLAPTPPVPPVLSIPPLRPPSLQARALMQLGHEVLVIAGAPRCYAPPAAVQRVLRVSSLGGSLLAVQLEAPVPAPCPPACPSLPCCPPPPQVELPRWGSLDAGCSWREFASGAAAPAIAAEAQAFRADAVLGVDWHSAAAYDALAAATAAAAGGGAAAAGGEEEGGGRGGGGLPPFLYLNYRVYHRTASPAELAVIEAQEERALRLASTSLVLSAADAAYLRRHFPAATDAAAGAAPLHVLLPALRADMEALPPPPDMAAASTEQAQGQQQAHQAQRRYLTCCVRLSPEKEPHRFVELLEALQRRGALERLSVLPLMAGGGWATEYGAELRQRLERHVPQVGRSALLACVCIGAAAARPCASAPRLFPMCAAVRRA